MLFVSLSFFLPTRRVINKGIGEGVLLVFRMSLTMLDMPIVVGREEGVGGGGGVGYLGEEEPMGQREGLSVDLFTADDIHLVVLCTAL